MSARAAVSPQPPRAGKGRGARERRAGALFGPSSLGEGSGRGRDGAGRRARGRSRRQPSRLGSARSPAATLAPAGLRRSGQPAALRGRPLGLGWGRAAAAGSHPPLVARRKLCESLSFYSINPWGSNSNAQAGRLIKKIF